MKYIFIPVLLVLLFISCNEDPTSVGSDLIPDGDKLQFKQLDSKETPVAQSSHFYEANVNLGTSSILLLGKNSDVESVILLRFFVPFSDSMVTFYKNNQFKIKQVWMEMVPTYKLGDASQNFSFSVHQARSQWSSLGFNKDSLTSLHYDAQDIATSKTLNDTLLTFNIDTKVVEEWLKYRADSLSAPKNLGLFFKPSANCQRFLGFNAYGLTDIPYLPLIRVEYEQKSTFIDTLVANPFMDQHVVTGAIPPQSQYIYLQGGLSLRGFLSFDISALPKEIVINSAKLELSLDTLKTIDGTPSSDSIFVKALKDSITKKLTADSLVVSVLKRNGNIYSGEITWLVQKWASAIDDYSNQGVELSLSDEERSASRITIHGSKSEDITLRPRVKIIYMQKKQ
jgi:hypothetical protein